MCICIAVMFTACSTETSYKSETTVSVSTNTLQDLMEKGDKNLDAGKIDEAIKNYTEAIETDNEFPDAYNSRGFAYCQKGEYDKAIADFS